VCLGRCDGQCNGGWEPQGGSGQCSGVCTGGCQGEVSNPFCTGEYAPHGTDPVCLAACGAQAAMAARCDAPLVRAAIRGGKPTPELERLLAGVQVAVPKILRIQQGMAKRLTRAIDTAATASVDWTNAFTTAGARPLFCIRKNIDAMKEAEKWIELDVRATEAILPAIHTDPIAQGKPEDE
jgi:hypothetical protein